VTELTGDELYFHVCYVVPELEPAMAELTRTVGVSWQDVRDRSSLDGGMRWRLVYTRGPLPWIELVEGQPGTPWHSPDGPRLHHFGGFTHEAGGRIEVDGREISGRWAYFRLPTSGALIELIEADDADRRERLAPAADG
jgi:hypothetical protein